MRPSDEIQVLHPRQNSIYSDEEDAEDERWNGSESYSIKWSLIGTCFLIVILFLSFAYWHAKSRSRKGLKPLAYHRWLVPRRQRVQLHPAYQNQYRAYPVTGDAALHHGYPIQGYASAPPVYKRTDGNTPLYFQPSADSKVNPNQADYAKTLPAIAFLDRELPAYPAPVAGSLAR